MTVGELINILSTKNKDYQIIVKSGKYGFSSSVVVEEGCFLEQLQDFESDNDEYENNAVLIG